MENSTTYHDRDCYKLYPRITRRHVADLKNRQCAFLGINESTFAAGARKRYMQNV